MEVPFKVIALILEGVYYIVKNEWMNKLAMHRPLVRGGHTLRLKINLFHMPEVHRWEKTKSVSTWTLPKFVQRAAPGGGSWAKLAPDCPGLEKSPPCVLFSQVKFTSQTSRISITWELFMNAKFRLHPDHPTDPRRESSNNLCFNRPSR